MPPSSDYVEGSSSGIASEDPGFLEHDSDYKSCGDDPYHLTWNFNPSVSIAPGEVLTQTFQIIASWNDGTFYNRPWVKYTPWWDTADNQSFSAPTSPITVGTGLPYCGGAVLVSKDRVPDEATPGVATEFTYTITIDNKTDVSMWVNRVDDTLPPDFTYVNGSTSGLYTIDPTITWIATAMRYRLRWGQAGPLASGEIRTLTFKATATLAPGVNYYNNVEVEWECVDPPGCPQSFGDGNSYNDPGSGVIVAPEQ